MRRRAFVVGTLSAACTSAACGKTRRPLPTPVWFDDVELAFAEAKRTGRPVFIVFGATWDTASKELEHSTFTDPDVVGMFHTDFVLARVDCSDDEDPKMQRLVTRFHVIGTPTMVVVHPRAEHDLWRATEYMKADKLVIGLRAARARHDATHDIDAALRLGAAWHRPVVFFFGPAYDHGSEAIRRQCLTDPDVKALLRDAFVFVDVWCDEGSNDDWSRLRVRGSPSTIVYDAERDVELSRAEYPMRPREYVTFLRDILARCASHRTPC